MQRPAHTIGVASLILVIGFAGSRALGVVRNIALAAAFGAGPELDAYFAAFRLPDTIFQLLAGAALGSAFIPTFAHVYSRTSPLAAWRLATGTLILFTSLGALFAGAGLLLSPWLVPLTVPGFPSQQQELTVTLTRIMLISTVFFCASISVTGILNARSHFLFPALAPWMYNLGIIAGTLIAGKTWGPAGPAWGAAIGAFLHLLIQVPKLRSVGMRFIWAWTLRVEGMAEVISLTGPRVLGLATIQVNWLVTTVLASTLSAGSVAAINYAWAVTMLPISLLGMAPATAAFPTLADAAAREDWSRYRATLSTGLRLMFFLAAPSSIGLMLLREPVIILLFQRGLFDETSTKTTATALLFFACGITAHVFLEIVARGSYALRNTTTPLLFALLGMAAHLVFSLSLIGSLGLGGIALSMSLAATIEASGLMFVLVRQIEGFLWRELLRSGAKTLTAAIAMTAMVSLVRMLFPQAAGGGLASLFQIVVAASGGGITFLGVAWLLQSEELGILSRQFLLRTQRSTSSDG